ncbi:hypothetical protein ACU4GR_24630 [Methylobacterium oryzae CBMB20]
MEFVAIGIDQDQVEPVGSGDLRILDRVGERDASGPAGAGDPADHRERRRGEAGRAVGNKHRLSCATFVREREVFICPSPWSKWRPLSETVRYAKQNRTRTPPHRLRAVVKQIWTAASFAECSMLP